MVNFVMIDDEDDYNKDKLKDKRKGKYNTTKYNDERKERIEQKEKDDKEYNETKKMLIYLYALKINRMNDNEILLELLSMLSFISFMNDPIIDTVNETKVESNFAYYPGWISSNVRQNIFARERSKILFSELNKRFSNFFSLTLYNQFSEISQHLIDYYTNTMIKSNVNLGVIKHNLNYMIGLNNECKDQINLIPNACNDCMFVIRTLLDIANQLETILLLGELVRLKKIDLG